MAKDLGQPINQIDAQLGTVDLSPTAHARIANRLSQEADRYGRARVSAGVWATAVFATGVAVGAVTLVGLETRSSTEDSAVAQVSDRGASAVPRGPATNVDGSLSLVSGRCNVAREGETLVLGNDCHLRMASLGLDVRTLGPSSVVSREGGVEVRSGWLMFEVDKVKPGNPPVTVEVPAGTVTVLGTQFVVWATAERGHVDLVEGRIQFEDQLGQTSVIEPGERVSWSTTDGPGERGSGWRAVANPPAKVDASVGSTAKVGPAKSTAARTRARVEPTRSEPPVWLVSALDEVQRLRSARRYGEALSTLERVRRRVRDRRTAEVLGYEAGTLLETLGDTRAACKHWRAHNRKFSKGRYRQEIEHRLAELPCDRRSATQH